jgi:ABC-type dipeptide/oligopeptide/nickel transport system permease component
MTAYLARRVLQAIPLLFVLAVLNFALVRLAPGDPVAYLVGDAGADPQLAARLRESLGLDRPMSEQFITYITNLVRGDLGVSLFYRRPVSDVLFERIPATVTLMATQIVIAILIGIPAGVLAARRRNTATDNIVSGLAVVGFSVPVFWSAQMLILLFAVQLRLLPSGGMTDARTTSEGIGHIADVARHLVLPALTLSLVHTALIVRITRASMTDVLSRDFVATARAKGLAERAVVWGHALRNSMLPIVTVIGLEFGQIFAGQIVTETVFSWPGIGRLMFESIGRRDYPVIMGGFLLAAVGVLVANLITDLTYARLDPRIRIGRGQG